MTNKFENKSAKEIAEDINNIEAGPHEVDAAFEALKSLDENFRKDVVDALENIEIETLREMVSMVQTFTGPIGSRTEALLSQMEDAEDLPSMQSGCQVILHISQIKGDAAQPMTKALVKELEKLSNEEYNSYAKLSIVLMTTCIKADAAELASKTPKTPNPFKKGPKGPGQ